MKQKTIKKEISSEELQQIKTQIQRIIFKDHIPAQSLSTHAITQLIELRARSSLQMRSTGKLDHGKSKSTKKMQLKQNKQSKNKMGETGKVVGNSKTSNQISIDNAVKKGQEQQKGQKKKNSLFEMWDNMAGGNVGTNANNKTSPQKPVKNERVSYMKVEQKGQQKKNSLFEIWNNMAGGSGGTNPNNKASPQKPVKNERVSFMKVEQKQQQTRRAQVLRDKYKLLDQRLQLIKQRFRQSRGGDRSQEQKQRRRQEMDNGQWSALGYYQRYSPLKKLLKVNGNLRAYQKHRELWSRV